MNASFKKWLLAEPKIRSAGFQYGFLAVVLTLLLLQVLASLHLPASYRPGRYFGFIAPLMLLLNHLAYQFRWSQPVTIVLRVADWLLLIFAVPCILFKLFTTL